MEVIYQLKAGKKTLLLQVVNEYEAVAIKTFRETNTPIVCEVRHEQQDLYPIIKLERNM